jgi:hypothetical protein
MAALRENVKFAGCKKRVLALQGSFLFPSFSLFPVFRFFYFLFFFIFKIHTQQLQRAA